MPNSLEETIKKLVLEHQDVSGYSKVKKEQLLALKKMEWICTNLWSHLEIIAPFIFKDLETSLIYTLNWNNNLIYLEPFNARFLTEEIKKYKMLWYPSLQFFITENAKKMQIDILRFDNKKFLETVIYHLERIQKCNLFSLIKGIDNGININTSLIDFFNNDKTLYDIKPNVSVISEVLIKKDNFIKQKVMGKRIMSEELLLETDNISLEEALVNHYNSALKNYKYGKELNLTLKRK